jgi:hypothetical protein
MISIELRAAACRALSKSGSLAAFHPALGAIADAQTNPEVIEFYCFLRDNSRRWETEWRPEFVALFHVEDGNLPKIDEAAYWGATLHALAAEGDIAKVRRFIQQIGANNWDIPPDEGSPWIDVYPVDADIDGETPSAKARRLGHVAVADYLENLRQTIHARYRERWILAYGKRS